MTLRIEIQEQPERSRFWAEVEVGGMIARRRDVTSPKADGLAGIIAAVIAAYDEMVPKPKVREIAAPLIAGSKEDDAVLDALRAEAEAAGVRVDGRWGEARLRQEIAAVGQETPVVATPTGD